MATSEMAIGMVGLGVMGRNLALNIEEKGFSVATYDAWPGPVEAFLAANQGKQIGTPPRSGLLFSKALCALIHRTGSCPRG